MTTTKIFQVQGNDKAHYISASSKSKAIKAAKEIYLLEKINFAYDFSDKFSEKERKADYIINSDEILN